MNAFWAGFWDNYIWIAIVIALFGGGALEGIQHIITSWGKATGSRRERALEAELDVMWERLRESYGAAIAWQRWGRSVDDRLRVLHIEGLPPVPEQDISLDNWPTVQQIRQAADRERETAIIEAKARRQARPKAQRKENGG